MKNFINPLSTAPLNTEPYQWVYYESLIIQPSLQQLIENFPTEGYEHRHSLRDDKSYRMLHRTIFDNRKSQEIYTEGMSEIWVQFISSLISPEYIGRLSNHLNHDLRPYGIELNFWQYENGGWLSPHTDKVEKVVSQLFYFNESWDRNWGGSFRVLNSNDINDCHTEIFPGQGNSIILIRSDNSWHAVTEQSSPDEISRRVLQLIFWQPSSTIQLSY